MIDNEREKNTADRMIGGASCHSDQLVLASNGHLFSLVSSVSLFSPAPVGPAVVRCERGTLSDAQWPLGSWAHRTDVQHAVKLPAAEVPLVSASLTVQILELSDLTKFSQVQVFPGHPMDNGSSRNAWPILAFRLFFLPFVLIFRRGVTKSTAPSSKATSSSCGTPGDFLGVKGPGMVCDGTGRASLWYSGNQVLL